MTKQTQPVDLVAVQSSGLEYLKELALGDCPKLIEVFDCEALGHAFLLQLREQLLLMDRGPNDNQGC